MKFEDNYINDQLRVEQESARKLHTGIVGEDMICPETNEHCDDECCPVGARCNIFGIDNDNSICGFLPATRNEAEEEQD